MRERARAIDVYLFPAVLGGGIGDIEEVLTVGRRLAADGHRILLFRTGGRDLPQGVDGPWDWPRLRRVARPLRASPFALTVAPAWGVTAAAARPGPLGRPGPWSAEAAAVEAAYGADRTLHVSIEEFARTLTSVEQTVERYREGGVAARVTRARRAKGELADDVGRFHRAYALFRGFDVPNLVHLFASFLPSRRFQREFPHAVQVGPILYPRPAGRPHRAAPARPRPVHWVAHASPASSPRLLVPLGEALARWAPEVRLLVRGDHAAPPGPRGRPLWEVVPPMAPRRWRRTFAHADLRVVTGSRTLLEALALGGPFLYFNGATGAGRRTRRHRPEKIDRLLAAWSRLGVPSALRRDIADVARLRRVPEVVRRAVRDPPWRSGFPKGVPSLGYPEGFERGEEVVAALALALPSSDGAAALVAAVRAGQLPHVAESKV